MGPKSPATPRARTSLARARESPTPPSEAPDRIGHRVTRGPPSPAASRAPAPFPGPSARPAGTGGPGSSPHRGVMGPKSPAGPWEPQMQDFSMAQRKSSGALLRPPLILQRVRPAGARDCAAFGRCGNLPETPPKWAKNPRERGGATRSGDWLPTAACPRVAITAAKEESLNPPASRPCAGRRNRWRRTARGSPAPPTTHRDAPSGGRCSKKDLRSASGLR